jgi:hypothetical protein
MWHVELSELWVSRFCGPTVHSFDQTTTNYIYILCIYMFEMLLLVGPQKLAVPSYTKKTPEERPALSPWFHGYSRLDSHSSAL